MCSLQQRAASAATIVVAARGGRRLGVAAGEKAWTVVKAEKRKSTKEKDGIVTFLIAECRSTAAAYWRQ
jgi:hypothetical protein